MRKGFFVLALLAFGFAAGALCRDRAEASKGTGVEEPARKVAIEAMDRLAGGDLAGTFAYLKNHTPLSEAEFNSLEALAKSQRDVVIGRYGQPLGEVEFAGKEMVGESLLRLAYLEKFERHALAWRLDFYRGPKGWLLTGLSWNNNPQVLFRPVP